MGKHSLILIGSLILVCLVAGAVAGLTWWFGARTAPAEAEQVLFQGVNYTRSARQSPRPMIVHLVRIDMQAKGIGFLVTPGDQKSGGELPARTTSDFLDTFGVQVAVNGDAFTPWHDNGPLDYYPRPNDPVRPVGLAASGGEIYSQDTAAEPVLYFARTNRARFNTPVGNIYQAISGNAMLVEKGKAVGNLGDDVQPRTAVGLDKRGRFLILVVVDGRQPGYSEGASLAELAQMMVENGAFQAMNLDGGGSSTLVVEGAYGPKVLNSPIHTGIPGQERPVGNHLGIFASGQ